MKNKNTYSLLVSSEEKGRAIFENAIYALVVVSVAFTGWKFASSSVVTPGMNRASNNNAPAEMVAKAPVEQPIVVATRS